MPTSGSSSDRSAHPNRLATDRASLEVLLLVALPNVEEVACEERVRTMLLLREARRASSRVVRTIEEKHKHPQHLLQETLVKSYGTIRDEHKP